MPSIQRINIGTPTVAEHSDGEEEVEDLKDINFKDIEKTNKYDGKGGKLGAETSRASWSAGTPGGQKSLKPLPTRNG